MEKLIKTKIMELISQTEDARLLEQIYNILDNQINYVENQLFDQLSEYHKSETLLSLKESGKEENLIDHDKVMEDIRNRYGWD